jgi:predicted DNA-binding transcriptional regulator YafY
MALNKKLWLIRLLYQHPQGLTRQEILNAWAEVDDRGKPMPPSTFHDQCNEIMRVHGVKAVKKEGRYTLQRVDKGEADFFNFLLERNEDFRVAGSLFLPDLHEAIERRRVVKMEYHSLTKAAYECLLSPYCLRFTQGNAYVVGFSSHHSQVRTFALDRIRYVQQLPQRFVHPTAFNAAVYFQHSYGAFGGCDVAPERVELQCSEWLTSYLRQRPLHPSQEETSVGRFVLNVALTKDFVSALLSFGANVKVVSPTALCSRLKTMASEVTALY